MPDTVTVKEVTGKRDLEEFLALPGKLYKNDPLWAPQIKLFEKNDFHKGTNPVLARSPHILLVAENTAGEPCGRIIGYEDPRYHEHYKIRKGFFGSFEADSPKTAEALLNEVEKWFLSREINAVTGPIDPLAECWGFTIEGFNIPPVFMSPHNPPEYPEWLQEAGYQKAKDLLVYEVDTLKGYRLPERYVRFEKLFYQNNPDITARRFNKAKFKSEIKTIVDITNTAVAGNWGFVPIGDDERDGLSEKLRLIVDPDIIWFIEDAGRPVACSLGFPDLNIPIRKSGGSLFPLGWLGLLRARKNLRDYRLWSLAVLPEYHGMGMDALMYINLYRSLASRKRGVRVEANYVLEDNPYIIIALEKLGMTKIKKYRVFEKTI